MILVTGASGTVGSAVVRELRKAVIPFRPMARAAGEIPDAVVADFSDKPSLKQALMGIEVVFLVCSPIPQLVELESNVIDACCETGVKHIVLNSALGAGDYPKSFQVGTAKWRRT